MEKNPYEFLHPVRGDCFVGRQNIINEMCQELSFPEGASYAIIGGRRFGKSSILQSLEEASTKDNVCSNVLFVIIDLNQHFTTPENFFTFALNEIANKAFSKFRNMKDVQKFTDIYGYQCSYQGFVDTVYALLECMSTGTRIVVLLDEIDSLLEYDWHELLFDQLRTLVYSSKVKNAFSLVVAGTYYYYETKKRGSPLMNVLRPIHLECLTKDAIESLAELGGFPSEETINAVWAYSGGHPHLAQYIYYSLWKLKPNFPSVNSGSILKIVKQYYRDYGANLKNWVTSAGEDGCRVYDVLQKQKHWLEEDVVARRAKLSMSRTNQALVNLCFHGLIYSDPETGKFRSQGDLFRNWFVQNRNEILGNLKQKQEKKQQLPSIEIQDANTINIVQAGIVHGNVSQKSGLSGSEIRKLFKGIYEQVKQRANTSEEEKTSIKKNVTEIEKTLSSDKPDGTFLKVRLENLQKIAPDILDVVIATITNPATGFALVARKVAEKMKKDTENSAN